MKFQLEITLGNDAMQTEHDIAQALMEVSRKLENGEKSGKIRDVNGNTVGCFKSK